MSYSFTRTREQLRDMVMAKLGNFDPGETVSSEDAATIYEAIDVRIKEMHRLGVFWPHVTKRPLSFALTAGVASASASVDILYPISMHVVDGSKDMPVDIIGIREYAAIENKAEGGVPLKALYNGSAEFIFWPVPTTSTTAKITYEAITDDTAANTPPDVDTAMLRWLKDLIAFDLGDEFGKSDTVMQRWERAAIRAELNIRKLAVQHVDYSEVRVDNFNNRGREETDYER